MLFQKGDLRRSLEQHGSGIVREVESAVEEHVLQADEALWAEALSERYAVEAPALKPETMWIDEPEPVQVDVSQDNKLFIRDRTRPFLVPGHRTVLRIPFTGEKSVFLLRPSSASLNPRQAVVVDGELQLPLSYPDNQPPNFQAIADDVIQSVEQHLGFARSDIEYFNSGLLNLAQLAIRGRRERIEAHRAHLAASGMRIGPPRNPTMTYIADVIVRRPAPVLPSAGPGTPIELVPVLADEVYEQILTDIRRITLSMETNPGTYAEMGEEDRRNVILNALNPNYQGTATAEGFNFGGKTDILIRHEGRNLFIAECKIWSGAQGFTDTLDQLFGYQGWRDTKLAVLMFVRARGVTTIVERGRAALAAHPQFVKPEKAASETELRATVSWNGDERRHASLNVFFISTPAD